MQVRRIVQTGDAHLNCRNQAISLKTPSQGPMSCYQILLKATTRQSLPDRRTATQFPSYPLFE